MLDTKSSLILKIIQKECKNGGYKIIDKNDIILSLPTKFRCDIDELDHIMTYLERQDLVAIKYDDENVYCVCTLPASYDVFDKQTKKKRISFIPLLCFVFAFLGAFLGCFLLKFLPI